MTHILTPLRWDGHSLYLIDQLALPTAEAWVECNTVALVADAIRNMVVRGAPAIGCAAAYGYAIGARAAADRSATGDAFLALMDKVEADLAQTRPTAVNLFWALAEMRRVARVQIAEGSVADAVTALTARAVAIHEEDIQLCIRIGKHGAELIDDGAVVLTHCNAGSLATGGYGTALGVIRAAREAGKSLKVFADETRPYLQGARLTAWELSREGFDVTVIPDSAAPFLISRGEVTCAIVGADRIAANGDTANKIGTYSVALACKAHGIPFYVAAPVSTLDLATKTGADIPIEERGGREMTHVGDTQIVPDGVKTRYPAFDITPGSLITAIITDRGIARAPFGPALSAMGD